MDSVQEFQDTGGQSRKPSEIVCIRGQAPIQATLYEHLEALQDNLGIPLPSSTAMGRARQHGP